MFMVWLSGSWTISTRRRATALTLHQLRCDNCCCCCRRMDVRAFRFAFHPRLTTTTAAFVVAVVVPKCRRRSRWWTLRNVHYSGNGTRVACQRNTTHRQQQHVLQQQEKWATATHERKWATATVEAAFCRSRSFTHRRQQHPPVPTACLLDGCKQWIYALPLDWCLMEVDGYSELDDADEQFLEAARAGDWCTICCKGSEQW